MQVLSTKSVFVAIDLWYQEPRVWKMQRLKVKNKFHVKFVVNMHPSFIGLSKNERPILDHHAKAHNFEIRQISCGFHEILGHSPHPAFIKLKSFCWNTCFYNFGWISQVKSGWNPPDFKGEIPHPAFIKLKSFCWNTCFYNFGWISQVISGWNPADFTGEICRISPMKSRVKSAGFRKTNCQEW